MNIGTTNRTKSTSGVVVEALRHSILRGELKANQPIRQQDLATMLGVSVIPVREALMVLEGEGLVTIYPNRGAVVSSLSTAEVHEIYLMRVALETLALRHALPNQTGRDWARADIVLQEIDTANDPARWSDLNWEFHELLYRPAAMPRLMTTLQTLYNNVARYFVVYEALDYHDEPQRAHRAILAACRERDADRACLLLEGHLKASVDSLTAYLTHTHENSPLTP